MSKKPKEEKPKTDKPKAEISLPYETDIMLPEGLDLEKTSSAEVVAHLMQTRQISRRANADDIDSLYQCLNDYLMLCMKMNVPITNRSLYAACGLTKDMVGRWASGAARASDPRYKEFALTLRGVASQFRELAGATGVIQPVLTIWWQKNYDGFRDNPTEVIDDKPADERPADPEELRERYKHLLKDMSAELEGEARKRQGQQAYIEEEDEI